MRNLYNKWLHTKCRVILLSPLLNWKLNVDVLLTVHLSIFISVIKKFLFYNKFISCLYMFRAHVFIIRMSKLHYTASGIITPIGGRLVHSLSTCARDGHL